MTKEEKLLSLVQPISYVSKVKLYCNDCKKEGSLVAEFKNLNMEARNKQIEIKEYESTNKKEG